MGTQTADMTRLGVVTRRARGKKGTFWRLIFTLFILLAAVWYVGGRPTVPSEIVIGNVVALQDMPDGWRLVTVRLKGGEMREIRTLAPFFFKPGYKAKVGIYRRPLLADQYDIVGDWASGPAS